MAEVYVAGGYVQRQVQNHAYSFLVESANSLIKETTGIVDAFLEDVYQQPCSEGCVNWKEPMIREEIRCRKITLIAKLERIHGGVQIKDHMTGSTESWISEISSYVHDGLFIPYYEKLVRMGSDDKIFAGPKPREKNVYSDGKNSFTSTEKALEDASKHLSKAGQSYVASLVQSTRKRRYTCQVFYCPCHRVTEMQCPHSEEISALRAQQLTEALVHLTKTKRVALSLSPESPSKSSSAGLSSGTPSPGEVKADGNSPQIPKRTEPLDDLGLPLSLPRTSVSAQWIKDRVYEMKEAHKV